MASYNSSFNPPNRPRDLAPGDRRAGYRQPPPPEQERRQAYKPERMESERGTASTMRMPPLAIPRQDSASSVTTRSKAGPGEPTVYGYRRPVVATVSARPQPELRGKSSRNVLRRKPTLVARDLDNAQAKDKSAEILTPPEWTGSGSSSERRPSIERSQRSAEAYTEIFTRPARTRTPVVNEATVYPELDRYRSRPDHMPGTNNRVLAELPHKLATQDLPPAPSTTGTPMYSGGANSHHRYSGYSGSGYSASPSTRFSESPGPGPYSRDTTPTSMSSQSPGIMVIKSTTPRLRQGSSPAINRPPVTRRRAGSISNDAEAQLLDPQGLPALRESATSSSSNSTLKGEMKTTPKKKKTRLSPTPPSPPPRKSSQKAAKKTPMDQQESPSKPSLAPAKPVMMSPELQAPKYNNDKDASPSSKSNPPSRPSRDGTPDLHSQLAEVLPVVQSNLKGLGFSERRQSGLPLSRGGYISPSPIEGGIQSQQGSRLPSRRPSPSPTQPSASELLLPTSGLGIIPDLRPHVATVTSRSTASRTPSPSISNSKPRFAIFGRRNKTVPETTVEKATRKGPAAGTGHEGYGRYALRGRSTSATGLGRARDRSTSAASSSQESVASTSAHDPFLLERMSPVVIAGGGEIIENRNTSSDLARTDSNISLPVRPSLDSKTSNRSGLGHEAPRTTLWPSAMPRDGGKSTVVYSHARKSSGSSIEDTGKKTLAFRRSIQRLNSSTSAINAPKSVNIAVTAAAPRQPISSMDTMVLSDESSQDTSLDRKLQTAKPRKLEKRSKSPRKWNPFHREKPAPQATAQVQSSVQVSVRKRAPKAVPHYAMIDSSDENATDPLDTVNFEDLLRDAEVDVLSNEELDALQFGTYGKGLERSGEAQATAVTLQILEVPKLKVQAETASIPVLFSSPEPMDNQPPSPKKELHLTEETVPVRPSRLPQVGRIPKVVNSRPGATSPKSFSRPFARLSVSQQLLPAVLVDKDSVALGASPPKSSTPEPVERSQASEADISTTATHVSSDSKSSNTSSQQDFLAFSPRKNSAATSSSSGGRSFAGTTAVIPAAGAELEEDEVWDEYDDLMNDDTVKVPTSATSSHGHPFQYESYESRRTRKSKLQPMLSPTIKQGSTSNEPSEKASASNRRSTLTTSSGYSADVSGVQKDSLGVPTPTTPMSFADFFSGYGDRNNSVYGDSAKQMQRVSKHSSHGSASSSISRQRISQQENQSPISQVNLRVGSMTVSKWLTFGHVLFSPARDEIVQLEGPTKRHSILVIDGLGNDDWSFYAAETYPTSTFYNLSPTLPPTASSTRSSFPPSPPNHRQIQWTSPLSKIPFPTSNFDIVVFRFPAAMSEAASRNLISEAKRVLVPGGYLECAVLDLDMMNMGNRSRRAVRGLKVRMQRADSGVNVGSASDTILRQLARRGFADVKSCKVGVPVASTIPAPDKGQEGKQVELSLADMMRDESAAGDEGITKMVAKVGRWWYTRCYESALGRDERSIFADRALLRECEEGNASFKLVVAYAMKPDVGRRRTASV